MSDVGLLIGTLANNLSALHPGGECTAFSSDHCSACAAYWWAAAAFVNEPEGEERSLAQEIVRELANARAKHAPMHSLHEGYGVIVEELEEFWDEVRAWQPGGDLAKARKELVQVAAMAMRAILDVTDAAAPPAREEEK